MPVLNASVSRSLLWMPSGSPDARNSVTSFGVLTLPSARYRPPARALRSELASLFRDLLVPEGARADLRAHLPAERLRRRFDRLEQRLDPVLNHDPLAFLDRGELAQIVRHAFQVGREGVIEAPILAHHVGDIGDVDRFRSGFLI